VSEGISKGENSFQFPLKLVSLEVAGRLGHITKGPTLVPLKKISNINNFMILQNKACFGN
jgi:hypothetical protein